MIVTSVELAVHLVRDASEARAADCYLISGDSDAAPAVRMAMDAQPDGFFMCFFPPRRSSEELKVLMPNSFIVGREKFAQSLLPEKVHAKGNIKHACPPKWKPGSFEDVAV